MLKQLMNTEEETGVDRSTVGSVKMYPLKRIKPSAEQARKLFNNEQLNELAKSIREHGVLQPIVIRSDGTLVAGERRYRACKMAGLIEAPVIVRDVEDSKESYLLGLIENLQRVDLNPMEEAEAYGVLRDRHKLTQEQIAAQVGKPRSTVANALRLLKLPGSVQDMLMSEELTAGHAIELLRLESFPTELTKLSRDCALSGWSVSELRQHVAYKLDKLAPNNKPAPAPTPAHPDEHLDPSFGIAVKQTDNSEIIAQESPTGDGGYTAGNARKLPPPSSIWNDFEEVTPTAPATQPAPVSQPAAPVRQPAAPVSQPAAPVTQTAQVEEAPEMFVDEQTDTEQPETGLQVDEFQPVATDGREGAIMTFHDNTVLAEVAGINLDFSNVKKKFVQYRAKIVIELVDKAGKVVSDEVVIGEGDCQ